MNQAVHLRRASLFEIDVLSDIDDDACSLYASAGIRFDLGPEHPFVQAEVERWCDAVRSGTALLADSADGSALGLLILNYVDGAPHLEQLSVRSSAMRRGIGRQLVRHAVDWANERELWLTTYAHVPWNRPFYEREGFRAVAEPHCGPELRARLAEQRRWLPAPTQRVAMRRLPGANSD